MRCIIKTPKLGVSSGRVPGRSEGLMDGGGDTAAEREREREMHKHRERNALASLLLLATNLPSVPPFS